MDRGFDVVVERTGLRGLRPNASRWNNVVFSEEQSLPVSPVLLKRKRAHGADNTTAAACATLLETEVVPLKVGE